MELYLSHVSCPRDWMCVQFVYTIGEPIDLPWIYKLDDENNHDNDDDKHDVMQATAILYKHWNTHRLNIYERETREPHI